MIPRTLFTAEHETFRDSVRRFLEAEVKPFDERWQEQGYADKSAWKKAGENGFLCMSMPEEYGGSGADKLYSMVQMEELARINNTSVGWGLHSEIVAPYLLNYGTDALKKKYLPKMAAGEMVGAIAMTEPGAGSDLQSVKTSAVKKGDRYVINGSKTFITNGWNCDLVIVVAKTDPSKGAKGTSLIVVDTSMKGFSKGKRLKKMGLKGQDTAELFFDNVEAPAENLLGQENNGFIYLMQELPWERMQIAIGAAAKCEAALGWTIAYVNERKAFGKPVAGFQNTRFKLAEIATQVQVMRVFVDRCMELLLEKKLDTATASMAKYWATDMEGKVLDECLQLHGGYGFMWEFPISQAYVDARVTRIYGGTNEIMKEVISRSLGLGGKDG
ncbi:MAG TPA: acyl-CoA dehydrogenase family protein [Burkholderiales bacterium]|nr:acyl-CoA dehydrogenase family protein [Burkholderiales bacterium]